MRGIWRQIENSHVFFNQAFFPNGRLYARRSEAISLIRNTGCADMSDIIHLPNHRTISNHRADADLIGASAIHLLFTAGDPAEIGAETGNASGLPDALLRLRDSAAAHRLLEYGDGAYRIRGPRPGRNTTPGIPPLAEPLADALRSISSPACLVKLLDTSNDRIILAAGDILGALRENGLSICSATLAEQMAWTLITEGRDATRKNLSFIDEAMERELPEVSLANAALLQTRRRATEIGADAHTPISDGFLRITIERHSRRIAEAQNRAIGTIDKRVGELLAQADPDHRTPASSILADIVTYRTSPLALSQFDYLRLPATCRHEIERAHLVYRPMAGEGALSSYPGQSLADPESQNMASCLSSAAKSPEELVRIAAVYANIVRRNCIVVGATETEAAIFLDISRDASLCRHADRRHRSTSQPYQK